MSEKHTGIMKLKILVCRCPRGPLPLHRKLKLYIITAPKKRSRGNQLIHSRLTKTKSIGRGSRSRAQAGRHADSQTAKW